MEKKIEKATKGLQAVFETAMTETIKGMATVLTQKYNGILNSLHEENSKLGDRLVKMNEELDTAKKSNETAQSALSEAAKKNIDLQQQINDLEKQLKTAQATPASTDPSVNVVSIKPTGADYKHPMFQDVLDAVVNRDIIGVAPYLVGPAGTGKTHMCKQIAQELGLDFYMSAKVDDAFGIEGYMDGNGKYNETPFYKAMKFGGVFMFDEMDASDGNAITCFNTASANRFFQFPNGEMVEAHKDFYIIGAGNTFGTGSDSVYVGRNPLDAATLDRFFPIEIDYDKKLELQMADGDSEAVQFVHDLRKAVVKARISTPFVISYRGIKALVAMDKMWGTKTAVQRAITKGLDVDNVTIIYGNLKNKDNKYAKAFPTSSTNYANAA